MSNPKKCRIHKFSPPAKHGCLVLDQLHLCIISCHQSCSLLKQKKQPAFKLSSWFFFSLFVLWRFLLSHEHHRFIFECWLRSGISKHGWLHPPPQKSVCDENTTYTHQMVYARVRSPHLFSAVLTYPLSLSSQLPSCWYLTVYMRIFCVLFWCVRALVEKWNTVH